MSALRIVRVHDTGGGNDMEKNQWKTDRMIGFSAGVEAVERVCEKADIYKATRQKPPHFVLNVDMPYSPTIFRAL